MYHHIYRPGKADQPVLVLLHGTGGDENSLLEIANWLNEDYSILALRGDVSEEGQLRFFKRKTEGVYDQADLYRRGEILYQFLESCAQEYQFDMEDIILLGFSNGANMALNQILIKAGAIRRGILLAPMYPVDLAEAEDNLSASQVFLSLGQSDPLVPIEASKHVIEILESRGAEFTVHWTTGHQIDQDVLKAAKLWLENVTQNRDNSTSNAD